MNADTQLLLPLPVKNNKYYSLLILKDVINGAGSYLALPGSQEYGNNQEESEQKGKNTCHVLICFTV